MRHQRAWSLVWVCAFLWVLIAPPTTSAGDRASTEGSITVLTTAMGKPIPAKVEIRKRPDDPATPMAEGPPLRAAQTSEIGRTIFGDLPPGPYEIRVFYGDAHPSLGFAEVPDSGGPVALRVPCGSGAHVLEGRAIWRNGMPFRGWLLLERDEDYFGTFASSRGAMAVRSDDAGVFRFPGLLPGTFSLGCRMQGQALETEDQPILRIPREGAFVYVVDEGAGRVQGTVVGATGGVPVPNARLSVRSLGVYRPARTRSDSAGRYGMTVPEVLYPEMLVEAKGFAPRWTPLPAGDHRLDISLERAGVIEGRVLAGGAGAPVKGAMVHAVWDSLGEEEAIHRTAVTNDEGQYKIEDVALGPNTVFVLGGGWVTSGSSPWDGAKSKNLVVQATSGTSIRRDLRAVRAGVARIEVRTADGKPARAASLAIEPQVGELYSGSRWSLPRPDAYSGKTVDQQGQIEFRDLIPGVPYEGELWALGGYFTILIPATDSGKVTVVKEKLPARELFPAGRSWARGPTSIGYPSISGEVQGPAVLDRHLVKLRVRGIRSDGTFDGGASQVTLHAPCGGPFVIENLDPKRYLLTACVRWQGVEYGARQTLKAGASGVNLTLRPLPPEEKDERLIRILDASGRPVPRASGWVHAYEDSSDSSGCWVHAGAMRYEAEPGIRRVLIEVLRPRDGMGTLIDAGSHILGPISIKDVPEEIRLPLSHSIKGRVLGPDGRAVPGADVMAVPFRPVAERRRGMFVGEVHGRALSDEDGSYVVHGLGPGPYLVTVKPPTGFAWPDMVGPITPSGAELSLRLPRATTARLRIVNGEGKAMAGSTVKLRWRDADGRPCAFLRDESIAVPWADPRFAYPKRWTADATGYVEIKKLHPRRRYTLEIWSAGARSYRPSLTLEAWIPHSGEIALERAHQIAGLVRDHEGRPLPGFMVARQAGEGHWQLVRSDRTGRFRFENLVRGRHRIAAVGNLLGPAGSTVTTEVDADRTDVVLQVDARKMLRLDLARFEPGARLLQPLDIFLWPKGQPRDHRQAFVMTPGPYYVPGLEPDREYVACSVPEGGQPAFYEASVRAGGEPLQIRLSEGVSIRGRVLLTDGDRIEGLRLIANFGPITIKVPVSKEGAFEVTGLPPESLWTVVARATVAGAAYVGQMTVDSGESDVIVELAEKK